MGGGEERMGDAGVGVPPITTTGSGGAAIGSLLCGGDNGGWVRKTGAGGGMMSFSGEGAGGNGGDSPIPPLSSPVSGGGVGANVDMSQGLGLSC